ncbi:MAG TPA: 4Fe-4S binding protein [Caldisericia bacterium]|nr:4Fe-4S binding protein [Caldisericia bacterium]HPF49608.1 4Fe-4S binding protein [Caldisericia bacterium]HPI84476.1 4Fe-4S binding protein [Caldisericia bacterium]HPQ93842.1 4Fe-4S binding protein [Caldisericia bacterium]HRV75387.1 4Fe-4S binding protein [Caldisericia bacterium]
MSELAKKIKRKLTPGEYRIQVRIWVQWAFFALAAGPLFVLAPIVKQLPAPWYVCWSCPTGSGACALGTLQHFTGAGTFSFFTVGFLGLLGVLIGRATCAWVCPMGFLQEMLYKMKRYGSYIVGIIIFVTTMFLAWFTPFLGTAWNVTRDLSGKYSSYGLNYLLESGQMNAFIFWLALYLVIAVGFSLIFFLPQRKFTLPNSLAQFMRWFFFLFPFIFFVIITRYNFDTGTWGLGEVWWCKICPIGTITAGFPQMYLQAIPQSAFPIFGLTSTAFIGLSTYQGIFGEAQLMYFIKWTMTTGLMWLMINSKRFFCKGICPLGTIFNIFNWVSANKIKVDQANCRGSSCNWCVNHCPMDIAIYDPTAQWHCIRCLDCLACPFGVVKHEVSPIFKWLVKEPPAKNIPALKEPNPPNNPTFMQWAGFVDYTPPQARK